MNNVIVLYKNEDGEIYCQEISKEGLEHMENAGPGIGYWEEGGTILLDEIEGILNKEIFIESVSG